MPCPSRIRRGVCVVSVACDGVYRFTPTGWVRVCSAPSTCGSKLLLFGNRSCPASCLGVREYGEELAALAYSLGVPTYLVICTRFAGDCSSRLARRLFKYYGIAATPALVVQLDGAVRLKRQGLVSFTEGVAVAASMLRRWGGVRECTVG